MSTDIENWIDEALLTLDLRGRKVDAATAAKVYDHARKTFVEGNPRAWWLALKMQPTRWSNKEESLIDLIADADAQGWLIPESEQDLPLVFRLSATESVLVVAECPFFEYYFIDDQITRLVVENDHNEFLVCLSDVRRPTSDVPI